MLQPTTTKRWAAYPPRKRWVIDVTAYDGEGGAAQLAESAVFQAITSTTHLSRGGYVPSSGERGFVGHNINEPTSHEVGMVTE
jgi:hypothetical protein